MADINLKSETIDKAIDTFGKPLYDDVAKPAIQTSKNGLSFCSQFIVSGIKPFMYSRIKECEYKIKEIDRKLEEKYNRIPDQNKIEPRTNILGPAVDVLKYNLEEEHIKEMFINLIGNDMDITQQSKVLPSYIEIVKQLSKNDAEFITNLKSNNLIDELPIIKLKLVSNENSSFNYISPSFICLSDGNYLEIPQLILDNLIRLQILEVDYETFFKDETNYNKSFENLKNDSRFIQYSKTQTKHLEPKKGLLLFTNFGKNFIDICLS